jgi:uncharacterized protein involved in exopolysaccharide biosynthesis
VRDLRESVITEIDRSSTVELSASGTGRDIRHDEANSALSVLTIAELLWAERSFIFRTVLATLIVSTLVAFLLPKQYTATTRLMPPGYGANSEMALALPALADRAEGGGGGGGGGAGIMGLASQLLGMNTSGELFVGVIQSQTVEDRVIKRLGLMNVYWDKYLEDARKHLESNTSISVGSRTGIISVSVTDKKPDRAAEIAKAYVIELNQVLSEVNASAAHRERLFLEARLQEVRQRSDADAQEFALFASQNAAIDIPSQAKAMVAAGAELQGQLIVAESELKGLQQIYTAQNSKVKATQARVDELQRQADKFGGKDVDPTKDGSLSHSELYPSVRQLPLLGIKYLDLFRRTKIDDAVFELLTKEYEVAKIQEAREIPSAEVLDVAAVPEKKSFPHRSLFMLGGAVLGFLFAAACLLGSWAWQHTDHNDPGKMLAQDVLSRIDHWVQRTPLLRKIKAAIQRLAIWAHFHNHERPA